MNHLVEHALHHWRRYETAPTLTEALAIADELLLDPDFVGDPELATFAQRGEGTEALATRLEDALEVEDDDLSEVWVQRRIELCEALAIHLREVQGIGFAPGLEPPAHGYMGMAEDREPCQLEYTVERIQGVPPYSGVCRQLPHHPIHQ